MEKANDFRGVSTHALCVLLRTTSVRGRGTGGCRHAKQLYQELFFALMLRFSAPGYSCPESGPEKEVFGLVGSHVDHALFSIDKVAEDCLGHMP